VRFLENMQKLAPVHVILFPSIIFYFNLLKPTNTHWGIFEDRI